MTAELQARVASKLASLRQFVAACPPPLRGVRLVQCCGTEFLGARDVARDDVERQVMGSVSEGFSVDWVCRNQTLYLRVFASDGPMPSWERVFAEEDLADAKSAMRQADFEGDA